MDEPCHACTPERRCPRHLLAALGGRGMMRCGCCGKPDCHCEIGAITNKWLRSGAYRGMGLICLKPHYRVF